MFSRLVESNAPWLLDVVQSLLIAGLIVVIWKCPVPGREWRPAKELFRWGARYPLVFGLLLLLSAIIWGLVGRGYGLEDLFFSESPGVQLLSGLVASAVFLSVVFLQHVFDRSRLSWLIALEQALEVLTILPDWLLARLDRALLSEHALGLNRGLATRLEQAVERSRRGLQKASEPRVGEQLNLTQIDAIQSFVVRVCDGSTREVLAPLVALVNGIAVVILIGLAPCLASFPQRLPWLLGVVVGWLGAAWLAAWVVSQCRPSAPIVPILEDITRVLETSAGSAARAKTVDHRSMPLALRALIAFFALRLLASFSWVRDVPISGRTLNRSFEGLLIEGALAIGGALAIERAQRSRWFEHNGSWIKRWGLIAIAVVAAGVAMWRLLLWGLPFETNVRAVADTVVFVLTGLFVGAAIVTGGTRVPLRPDWMLSLAASLVLLSVCIRALVSGASGTIVLSLGLAAASLVAGAALVSLALRSRSRRVLAYPAALLSAYATVALLYNGLPEAVQARLPSALSIAALIGILTTSLMTTRAIWPEYGVIPEAVLIAAVFAWNGNAWQSATNAFKLQFPEMRDYYGDASAERRPVFLDTRAYFRANLRGVVRLRHETELATLNRQRGHGAVERLATATFSLHPGNAAEHLELVVRDDRNQLRLRRGDSVGLVLPEEIHRIETAPDGRSFLAPQQAGSVDDGGVFFELLSTHFERGTARLLAPGRSGLEYPLVPAGPELELTSTADDSGGGIRVLPAADRPGRLEIGPWTASGATWLALAPRWSGTVVDSRAMASRRGAIRLVIRFDTLPGIRETDATWSALRARIEQGHLVAMLASSARNDVYRVLPGMLTGECVVVERQLPNDENPRYVRTLVKLDGESAGPWRGHTVYDQMDELGREGYRIRADTTRGLFRALQPGRLEIAGASRRARGDRLLLRWTDREGTEQSRLVTLSALNGSSGGLEAARIEDESEGVAEVSPPEGIIGSWQRLGPLDNLEVLESWRQQIHDAGSSEERHAKPPLVIVAVSGGGIRASVWTATVLEQMEQWLGPRFPYHIRLVTGASGGMVAGAYYATSLERPHRRESDGAKRVSPPRSVGDRLSQDQLNSVAGTLVFGDLPGLLNPLRRDSDRGRKLEAAWIRLTGQASSPLERPLQAYAADEWLGWRPSLVFTPMMVEDGRRLIISNLDLSFVTRNIGGMLLDRMSEKIESVARSDEDRSIEKTDDIYSMSAVEFSRLFPDAHAFRVSTAVRMSASFPFISPAVSLPTQPPRRVVDAGYYDNYGVNLASLWLDEMYPWLVDNTSGVIIVQIRDHVSQRARIEMRFDQSEALSDDILSQLTWDAPASILQPGFQPLVTPLHGVASARQWSMSFRNDEQVELLDDILENRLAEQKALPNSERVDFFRTIVFECPVEASLSWTLSESERRRIQSGMGTPAKSVAGLKDYTEEDAGDVRHLETRVRTRPALGQTLEQLYRGQLVLLGCERGDLEGRSWSELKDHYTNVLGNRKRLQQLDEWWRRRASPRP